MRDDFGIEKFYLGRAGLEGDLQWLSLQEGNGVLGTESGEGWMDRS